MIVSKSNVLGIFTGLLALKWQKDSDLRKWEETWRQTETGNVGEQVQRFESPAGLLMFSL